MDGQTCDENPFSFKKFINNSSGNTTTSLKAQNFKSSKISTPPGDTQQQYASHQSPSNPFSFKQFLNETSSEQIKFGSLIMDDVESDEPVQEDMIVAPLANLPDFISESIQLDSSTNHQQTQSIDENPYHVLECNIPNLSISDNERSYFDLEPKVLSTITKTHDELIHEQQLTIQRLEKRIKELTKKEELENKTLEAMVQQIEQNLQIMTLRALDAEKVIEKLKYENKSIKERNHGLQMENDLLKNELCELRKITSSGSSSSDNQKPEITQFSLKLRNAASSAEESIRLFNTSIMHGVATLRQLADNLDSSEKIYEIQNERK